MARMVAATPKQIAMARQMVNSESHILHPPNSLSYLSCVFAACSASVSQRSAISMKNDFMCRGLGYLRQSNALSGVVA
jgi:hypothetical protein